MKPGQKLDHRRLGSERKGIVRTAIIGGSLLLCIGLFLTLAPRSLAALLPFGPQDALSYTEPGETPPHGQSGPILFLTPRPTAMPDSQPASPTPDLREGAVTPIARPSPSVDLTPAPTDIPSFADRATPTRRVSPTQTLTSTLQPPTEASPWQIRIPAIDLVAPVIGAALMTETSGDASVFTWTVPDFFAAGWHVTSALPGESGNTVLNGHNNIQGKVFRHLDDAMYGDRIMLEADGRSHSYIITDRHIVQEAGASLEARIANATWVAPTDDERLTLVTCWPPTGNSHRLIVIARPVTPADTFRNSYPKIR